MAEPIPLNQPPKDVVLALINRDNNTNFNFAQVDLTTLAVMPSNFARNTSVKIVDVPGGGYTDSEETVFYNRLDLAVQWSNITAVALADNPLSSHDLIDSINEIYDLYLTEDDIENLPYEGSPHTIVAKPGSFVWVGQKAFNVIPTSKTTTLTLEEEFEDVVEYGFVYSALYNYADTPLNLMYKMLAESNNSAMQYNAGHFTISALIPVVGNEAQVTLTAVNGSGFTSTLDVVYDRLSLSQLVDALTVPMTYFTGLGYALGDTITAEHLRGYINTTFGLALAANDVSFTAAVLNDQNTFDATASATNYLATGQVTLTFIEGTAPPAEPDGMLNFDGAYLTGYDDNIIVGFDVVI